MSPRPLHPIRILQLVCAFLLLHNSNWQASTVSGTGHLQSSTRVLQPKSGLLGGEVTMCERTLNTDYTANLRECKAKANKLFPVVENIDVCTNRNCKLSCQTELACQHCDDSLQDWLTQTQTVMNDVIQGSCKNAAGQFSPFMCPITVAPTTNLTTTSTTHKSTTRAPFPKWAIYTLASGVIIVIVLVILILWYGLTRIHHHDSSRHHESDSKQSLKSTRTHKSSSSRGSQVNHQHTAKSLKWHPQNKAIKKATAATPTLKKASSGKVASRGKVTTSSARRYEGKQRHSPAGPKMVNPKQQHSTGHVKKGH